MSVTQSASQPFYGIYKSSIGDIVMASNDGQRLSGLWFEGQKYSPTSGLSTSAGNCLAFDSTRQWLDAYFLESMILPFPPLELMGTDFQKRTWRALMQIDCGETATYSEIAKIVGCKSPRPIANAIAHNPIIIVIPCHRVISRSGALSGYAAGTNRKLSLLQHENKSLAGIL